ncbi:hypothetical protein TrRE_jg13403, partial [Triparma retinervis]
VYACQSANAHGPSSITVNYSSADSSVRNAFASASIAAMTHTTGSASSVEGDGQGINAKIDVETGPGLSMGEIQRLGTSERPHHLMAKVYSKSATMSEKLMALEDLVIFADDIGLSRCLLLGGILDSLLDSTDTFINLLKLANDTQRKLRSLSKKSAEYKSGVLMVNAARAKTSKAAGIGILSAILCVHLARSHVLYSNRPDEVQSMNDKECLVEMILDVPHYKDASTNPYERERRLRGFTLVVPSFDSASVIADKILKAKGVQEMGLEMRSTREDCSDTDNEHLKLLDSF